MSDRSVMDKRLRTYSLVLGAAFWGPLLACLVLQPHRMLGSAYLPALLAIAVAGEELVMRGREQDDEGGALSLSAVAHVAAAILLSPVAAALAAALGVVISDGLRRDGRRYLLLNSAMFGGSTWIAAIVYRAVAGDEGWGFSMLPALSVLILLRYVVTSLVFAGGMTMLECGSLLRSFARALVEEVPAAIGEGSMGVLVAFAIGREPVLVPFLLPLLAALFFSRANLERLRRETQQALQAMADVIDARDPSTTEHSERVAALVERFAVAISLPPTESKRLVAAARFHDLGKIAVDTRTLAAADRLTETEMEQIRLHPKLSAQLLRPFSFAREIAEFASLHHERWDGTGYFGVSGEIVPIEAHVLVAADSFDAMTSARPYRPALTEAEAVRELLDKAGTQFHPLVARAFAAVLRKEPLDQHLQTEELRRLRAGFGRARAKPKLARVSADPRLLAMGSLVLALMAAGTRGLPAVVPALLAAGTAAFFAFWLLIHVRLRIRKRRALEAARAGQPARNVVTAAGFGGWASPIDDDLRHLADGHTVPSELPEIQSWIRLGAPDRMKQLAARTWAVRSRAPRDGRYTVIGIDRRPRIYEVELLEWLADLVQDCFPSRPHPQARTAGGERAIAKIELDAFERLRRGAGQLVAERIIEETERRLRSVLRPNDAVIRLGDDVFAVSLVLAGDSLELVEQRLRETVANVRLPQRLAALQPRVEIVRAADSHQHPQLAEIEDKLFPSTVGA